MSYLEKIKNQFGKVKIDLIPNVSEFNTFIESYSVLAAIFGLKSPNRKNTISQFKELKKANRYVIKQNYRLMKYAQEGRMAEHDYLMRIILEKSDAFLVVGINQKGQSNKGRGPRWYQKNWCQVVSLVSKTRRVSKGDIPLEFKRVWIDKKPNDYARPLGAIKRWFAIYGFNLNRQIEHVLQVKNLLTPWQHGGRSFKGTHTAWEQVIQVLKDKPFIFEFDIKGFYDNIKTDNVVPFLGELMAMRVQQIVNQNKPTEYTLPPLSMDQAVQIQEQYIKDKESLLDDFVELMTPDPGEDDPVELLAALVQREGDSPDDLLTKLMNEFNEFVSTEVPLSKIYESHMKGNSLNLIDFLDLEHFSNEDRAIGRDMWKNLAQEGRGFPQGLSISPILSTNLLERTLPDLTSNNITMYMDDGLIYGNTKAEVLQIINKLEAALEKLGISMAPEKSGWVRENWTFVKSSKFLAIRIKEDGTLISETRSGTTRAFPNPLNWEDYKEFCNNLEINPSLQRITYKEIYEVKGKEHIIGLGNIMGNILNYMYAPEQDHNSQELKILRGRMSAIEKILKTRHKTLDKLEHYFPEPITRPGLGERLEAVRLGSVSSIASCRLLRYLKVKRMNKRVRA